MLTRRSRVVVRTLNPADASARRTSSRVAGRQRRAPDESNVSRYEKAQRVDRVIRGWKDRQRKEEARSREPIDELEERRVHGRGVALETVERSLHVDVCDDVVPLEDDPGRT